MAGPFDLFGISINEALALRSLAITGAPESIFTPSPDPTESNQGPALIRLFLMNLFPFVISFLFEKATKEYHHVTTNATGMPKLCLRNITGSIRQGSISYDFGHYSSPLTQPGLNAHKQIMYIF